MIFTATETSTRFYITKGWSANSETPLQEITLDYLTIVEIPNQILPIAFVLVLTKNKYAMVDAEVEN